MAHDKEIRIFPIASTKLNKKEVRKWLDSIGAFEFELPANATDADGLVGLAGKRCYNAFQLGLNKNLTKVRSNWVAYIDNILKSGHGSVCEHASFTFALEGITRIFTAEMNRHRAGIAISEGSLRYIRFDDIGYWVPLSIREDKSDDYKTARKKHRTRQLFKSAFLQMQANYAQLEKIWKIDAIADFHEKKKLTSMFRRIIGMGASTGAVYTLNARALRHVLAMRSAPEAEEEIAHVFTQIGAMMFQREDKLFGDFYQTPEGFWVPKYKKI